jgi:hypothetical protein
MVIALIMPFYKFYRILASIPIISLPVSALLNKLIYKVVLVLINSGLLMPIYPLAKT